MYKFVTPPEKTQKDKDEAVKQIVKWVE